ncbi:hypothetical protein EUX98_g5376 [Antrodiella citrinella]|uniref:Uncharacterized protein n=1 Tax=Antrodiella citrinella TaxID=2447956 RepID=A0A4S4MZG4_9APHY|nr:hypothetical protein EUX98_g5376 [Antrodiella citrinella]
MSLVFRRESIDKFFEQWQDSDPEGLVKGLRRVDGLPEDNVQALINILWAALAPENSALRQRLAARFDEDAFTEDELRKLTTELCIAYDRLPYAVVLDGVRANVSASIYVTHLQREVEGTFKKKTITLISPRLDVVPHEREGITLRVWILCSFVFALRV